MLYYLYRTAVKRDRLTRVYMECLYKKPGESETGMAEQSKKKFNNKKHGTNQTTDIERRKWRLTVWTKFFLDFMFYMGILVIISLPFSIHWAGRYLPPFERYYWAMLVIYFILGVSAILLIRELRKIFRTVLAKNCFVQENVASLRRMGNVSFFIVIMSLVRCIVFLTIAMVVVSFVFIVAGLFSKVLAYVFEEAVRYKEENDMTI